MQKKMVNGHTQNGWHTPSNSSADFRIAMVEPVLQGYASSTQTEVVIVPPSATVGSSEDQQLAKDVQEIHQYDIDEDFLAASCMGDLPSISFPKLPNGSSTPLVSPSAVSEAEASMSLNSLARRGELLGRVVQVEPLRARPNAANLSPKPSDTEDEHLQIFVRAADLGKYGLFSGDLVSVCRYSLASRDKLIP